MERRGARDLLGYEAPIRIGTWQRILHCGAPRMLSYAWMIACLWVGLLALGKLGFRGLLVVGGVWLSVQILMAVLTWWNVNWDSAVLARVRRRYQPYYRAG
jgi:hypothetical protein